MQLLPRWLGWMLIFSMVTIGRGTVSGAELMVEGDAMGPTTSLEVRFAVDMISRDEIGVAAAESPLVVTPPLKGAFTWLSRRSGVFVPAEAPRLAMAYRVTLQKDLTDAAGERSRETLDRTLRTSPFQIARVYPAFDDQQAIAADQEVRIVFNLGIDLESAQARFEYVDEKGEKVPAAVRFPGPDDYFRIGGDEGDWMARWERGTDGPSVSDDDPSEKRDRLIVSPKQTLRAGTQWRLRMLKGVRAAESAMTLEAGQTFVLGKVAPFKIEGLEAASYVNSGRSVTVIFSKPIGPDVDSEEPEKFFNISPAVPGLALEEGYESVVLRGDFQRDVEYTLTVDPSLLSSEALPLSGERVKRFRFEPVKPRIYLPAFTGHQIADGRRKFDVTSVNLSALRVKALRVDPAQLAQAVSIFKEKYHRPWNAENTEMEPYQALPDEAIHGETIHDRTIELPSPVLDAAQSTELDWSEILGASPTGTVLFTVEGVPMKEAGGLPPAAQSLMQLTDLGVFWELSGSELQLNVFSMKTGRPVADAQVTLLNNAYEVTASATTDEAGKATVPPGSQASWLITGHEGDVFALPMGESAETLPMAAFGLPIYHYGAWNRTGKSDRDLRGIIFTDRPLYRAGETVHVKGMVRRMGSGGLEIEPGRAGKLTMQSSNGQGEPTVVEVKLDDRGAFDAELELDAAADGRFGLSFQPEGAGSSFFESILVADYQPDAFEVKLQMSPRFAPSETVAAEVSGRYLFGSPIERAQVRWTVQSGPNRFEPEGFNGFSFGLDDQSWDKLLTLRGEGDLENVLSIVPRLPGVESAPQKGILTVEVTDLNQQTVSTSREFTRDAAGFYLGLPNSGRKVFQQGEEIDLAVVAVAPTGEPLGEPVALEAELKRIKHRTVRVLGAGGAVSFSTDHSEETVAKATGRSMIPVEQDGLWTVEDGHSLRFSAAEAGNYKIVVTAKDGVGRKVASSQGLSVSGEGNVVWDYRHPAQIELRPDRPGYRVGDQARIMVQAPFSGRALVRVGRGDEVLREWEVELTGNAPLIEVPVLERDAPNIFVSLTLLRGAEESTRKFKMPEYRYGVCQLLVDDPGTTLRVSIDPARKEVRPADEVEALVRVTGHGGVPVADAEVTFYAIDDGVLALSGFERPDPGSVFGKLFSLNIPTGISLMDLLPEDPADLVFGNKGYLIGGGGLEGPGAKIRTDFPGTAVWLPSLRTGADGTVMARFKAPDALTRYRLVAVASAGAKAFGSAESAFTIKQPLIMLSALGAVARAGDRLLARAVLRNESGGDGTAKVSLALDESARADGGALEATFALKKGETRAVDFPVEIRETGEARWIWSAELTTAGGRFDDRLESRLRIGPPAPLLREIYLTELKEKRNDLLTGVNPQMLEGTGSMTVVLSNTRLATLRTAAEELLTYPYGCAEQLVSGLIPWVAVTDLRPVLPSLSGDPEEMERTIREGVAKIFEMQQDSGGLSYWPGGKAAIFPSAWAVIGLARVDNPRPTGWDDLIEYLQEQLRGVGNEGIPSMELEDRVLAAYALATAGAPEQAYHEVLYRRRAELSDESRALLALALMEAGEKGAMIGKLLDPKMSAPESFSWFGGEERERAIQLMAWSRYQPKDPEMARRVAELLQARRNGSWRTTQGNAWALLALSEYFARVEGRLQPVSGTLNLAGEAQPFELTTETLSTAVARDFSPQAPPGPLTVENSKERNLYGETRFVVRPPVADQPRQDRGYAVSRRYQKIASDGTLAEAEDLKVGDRLVVTVRVETPVPGHFVAIDDPLPAILEAVNPEFQSKGAADGPGSEQPWAADHREIRSDRVVYFCDHLPAGAHTFRYLARVRSAGEVIAPGTKAEEMYRPERFGLGASARLASRSASR